VKTTGYDGTNVRKILTGMIMDKSVCSRISGQWPSEGLFDAPWSNIVGGMVVSFYKKYGSPPQNQMLTLYEDWSRKTVAGEEMVESVEKFLQAMSDEEYDETSEHIIDLAGEYFNKVRMENAMAQAKEDLANWRIEEAKQKLQVRSVNLGKGSYVSVGEDVEAVIRAFDTEKIHPLVEYRGPLQKFLGNVFCRGRLFCFMAPDKTGKTTWLLDFAYRALKARNRVAIFDTGDAVDEGEIIQKLICRATGMPKVAGEYQIPKSWESDEVIMKTERYEAADPIMGFRELAFNVMKNQDACRISAHPSSSLSASDVDEILAKWDDEEDWRPDVVIVDYADILAPPTGFRDTNEQIDETWKTLRRTTQKRHCLMMTATQTSSLAYGKEEGLLGKKHFSGRKTKLAHVSGMIGINVTDDERDKGLCRINKFAWRHAKHNEKDYVRVAGCGDIGSPAILSKWK
jgi:hypothetical protein